MTTRKALLALLLPLLVLAGCQDHDLPTALAPERAAFATFTVGCDVAALIAALEAANASAEADVISLAEGCTYTLTQAYAESTNGLPAISGELTIHGNGATIQRSSAYGTPTFRILQITSGATVNISGLTVSEGSAAESDSFDEDFGGGIWNEGTLTLTHSTVTGNFAFAGGGGIYNRGMLTLSYSTVTDNRGGAGGGISNEGTLMLTHSTVWDNRATAGGGIYSFTSDDLSTTSTTILNSTISGNEAANRGGGAYNVNGLTRIVHSTITGNQASDGGGVWSWNDDITGTDVKGSLIWGNTLLNGTTPNDVETSEDATHPYNSLGHNLIGAAGANVFGLDFNQTGDQRGVLASASVLDPQLRLNAPGTTKTHALLATSPARDAIPAEHCTDHTGAALTTDQRGIRRPQGAGCDIGAFELEPASTPVFGGFLPPVDREGLNVAKAGRAVPIQFSLGGDFGLERIFAQDYPKSVPLARSGCTSEGEDVPTITAGQSSLSYDEATDTYTYVWKTEKGWAGSCRRFEVKFLGDANTYTLEFSFTR